MTLYADCRGMSKARSGAAVAKNFWQDAVKWVEIASRTEYLGIRMATSLLGRERADGALRPTLLDLLVLLSFGAEIMLSSSLRAFVIKTRERGLHVAPPARPLFALKGALKRTCAGWGPVALAADEPLRPHGAA